MSRDCAKELGLLVKAGWRLIALETFEEERALATLEARRAGVQARARDLVRRVGPRLDRARRRARSTTACARSRPRAEPAHVRDPRRAPAARTTPSRCAACATCSSCSPSACRRSCCSGPRSTCPPSSMHEAAIVELPLPRGAGARRASSAPRSSQPDAESLEGAVRAALGLTADEALRVFRKSCALAGGLNEKAVAADRAREAPGAAPHAGALLPRADRRPRRRRRARRAEALAARAPARVRRGGAQVRPAAAARPAAARRAGLRQVALARRRSRASGASRCCASTSPPRSAARDQTPEATIREATAVAESIAPVRALDRRDREGLRRRERGRRVEPRVRRVPHLALGEAGAGVRGGDGERRDAPAARAAAPRPLRRPVLRRPAHRRPSASRSCAIHLRRFARDPLQFDLEELALQASRLSGSELEQVVSAALYTAFTENRDLGVQRPRQRDHRHRAALRHLRGADQGAARLGAHARAAGDARRQGRGPVQGPLGRRSTRSLQLHEQRRVIAERRGAVENSRASPTSSGSSETPGPVAVQDVVDVLVRRSGRRAPSARRCRRARAPG